MTSAIINAFTAHPSSVDESYGEHFAFASRTSLRLMAAGLAALVHAVFPFLCVRTASDIMREMHAALNGRRPD